MIIKTELTNFMKTLYLKFQNYWLSI